MKLSNSLVQCSFCKAVALLAGEYTEVYIRTDWEKLDVIGIVLCPTCAVVKKAKNALLRVKV